MKTYYVIKRPDCRVIISSVPASKDEVCLNEIKATSWTNARKQCVINEFELYQHIKGYGYYAFD